jgi:hypothetical protein
MTDSITQFILKPAGPLAAGVVLFGVVWGFFKGVESVLTDGTKLEIAVWLLGRKKFGPKVQSWPATFAKLFDRVFGQRHLSWKCARRSCVASVIGFMIAGAIISTPRGLMSELIGRASVRFQDSGGEPMLVAPMLQIWLLSLPFGFFLPDFVSLLETRLLLKLMSRYSRMRSSVVFLVLDACFTIVTAALGARVGMEFATRWFVVNTSVVDKILAPFTLPGITIDVLSSNPFEALRDSFRVDFGHHSYSGFAVMVYPGCISSLWLWLYAGAGFLLKAARRFDIGFEWFNRHFDIEKKPLQSIGLVAGALVAVVYWTAVIVGRVVG